MAKGCRAGRERWERRERGEVGVGEREVCGRMKSNRRVRDNPPYLGIGASREREPYIGAARDGVRRRGPEVRPYTEARSGG